MIIVIHYWQSLFVLIDALMTATGSAAKTNHMSIVLLSFLYNRTKIPGNVTKSYLDTYLPL